jgi:plasmid stabilization system protein ParE
MKTELKILWSKESKFQFDRIVLYLRKEWTEKEVNKFIVKIREFEQIVVKFPEIYAESNRKADLRRAVLSKHNSVIYKIDWEKSLIRVYTIFDNRQHPDKLK